MEIKYHTFDITSGGKLTCPILENQNDIKKIIRLYNLGRKAYNFEEMENDLESELFFDEITELYNAQIVAEDAGFGCFYLQAIEEKWEYGDYFIAIRIGAFRK